MTSVSTMLVVGMKNITATINQIIYLSISLAFYCYYSAGTIKVSVQISHLPPGERGYGHTGVSRVLNVTMLRGLSQTVQEVDSRKVSAGDFEHILGQCPGGALTQCDIGDLKWDEAWDDVNRHPNVIDIRDPVGGIKDESVIDFAGIHLHVLDVPTVNVLLGKCLDGGLFGSDVALFVKTAEKTMRRGYLDYKYNLRWQVVLVSDLQQSENIFSG